MRTYTAHLKPGREPVLVREGFAWGAFVFGPLWFLIHRAWIAAVLHLALLLALPALVPLLLPGRATPVILLALGVLAGLLGRDVLRWSLDRRGYSLAHVLAARDEEGALARLLTYRPEIATALAARLS